MSFLVGELNFKRWVPKFTVAQFGFSRQIAARMIVNWAATQRNIQTLKRMKFRGSIKFLRSQDLWNKPCAPCSALRENSWRIGEAPEIPYSLCENSAGGRCVVVVYND